MERFVIAKTLRAWKVRRKRVFNKTVGKSKRIWRSKGRKISTRAKSSQLGKESSSSTGRPEEAGDDSRSAGRMLKRRGGRVSKRKICNREKGKRTSQGNLEKGNGSV